MSFIRLLFGFSGRISRAQYWLGSLMPLLILAFIFAGLFSGVAEMVRGGQSAPLEVIAGLGRLILPTAFGMLLCIWITAALYTKRLHDRGKSAVWLLAIYVPAFLPLISLFYFPKAFALVGLLSAASSLWNFIELGCMGSKEGPNRFDTDPSGGQRDTAAGYWDAPQSGGPSANLGGMAAAMAAINAAARDNQGQAGATRPDTGPQFGQQAPAQFGRLNAGAASGGFGRRGLGSA